MVSGQQSTKEWRNAVNQVITFRGFGFRTWAVAAARGKIAICSLKAA
jgi:hypothetical protein